MQRVCALSSAAMKRSLVHGMSRPRVSRTLVQLTAAGDAISKVQMATTAFPARHFATHAHHSHRPRVLVVGGNGALGSAMIDTFGRAGWRTISMDFAVNPSSDSSIVLSRESTWKANLTVAEESLKEMSEQEAAHRALKSGVMPLAAVVHCAGSWLGGSAAANDFIESVEPMLDINLKSAIGASHLAAKFLSREGDGLLVLTGAAAASSPAGAAAMSPTSGMLAYGMSKAATHHLALGLAQPGGGIDGATVVCVLPTMIDTPANRRAAPPDASYDQWTPPSEFAQLALAFAQQLQAAAGHTGKAAIGTTDPSKPVIEHAHATLKQGGFYVFNTDKGKTSVTLLPQ